MFDRILLAYDGSSKTEAALMKAAELARLTNAELHLLGVVMLNSSAALSVGYVPTEFFTLEEEAIEKALEDAIERLDDRLSVHTKILEGDPAERITSHAHDIGADLVVIGHADKSVIERWLEGSTGSKLIRELPCSLLIAT